MMRLRHSIVAVALLLLPHLGGAQSPAARPQAQSQVLHEYAVFAEAGSGFYLHWPDGTSAFAPATLSGARDLLRLLAGTSTPATLGSGEANVFAAVANTLGRQGWSLVSTVAVNGRIVATFSRSAR